MRNFRYMAAAALTALAVVVFAVTLVRATLAAPVEEAAAVTPPALAAAIAPGDYPAKLRIPALSIDAQVQKTGLTKSGAMGTPTNFTDVAWYQYGPAPGQLGSAVIDGHVDNALSLPGVFKHLGDIAVGDDIYIDTKDGKALHFVVTEIESYPYKAVPTERIFEAADRPRLNLVTCDGSWMRAEKTYDERLVVYAELR